MAGKHLPTQTLGINKAVRAASLRKGPPTEDDVPPPKPFHGKRIKLVPGQLDINGDWPGDRAA
jgi:hypothetical protein